ncbi:uncharacterized protein LOC126678383 [Mercurialis annua]|uniref:uncharacterized protein LOC126678383 n=1 Tax=Mercurialis annua TaxID=3986 RepID=UPI00215FA3CD|nr:uncharacterized protein LOC126678383 [Mercurialis annua]
MVLSWILRSLSPSIAQSGLWIDSALEVWKDLFDRFSQENAVRMSDLQEEMYAFKQNALFVADYFTHLKILWDEYSNLRIVPVCSCNPQRNCDALKVVKDQQDADYIIRLLKGLSESYSIVRIQVLMKEPLPKINKVFSMVLHHERQMGLGDFSSQIVEPFVFATQANSSYQRKVPAYGGFNGNRQFGYGNYANNFRPQRGQRKFYNTNNGDLQKPVCTFCGLSRHTVEFVLGNMGFHQELEDKDFVPVFTKDQYKQLMNMLQQNAIAGSPKINTIATNFNAANIEAESDSGATDHITCSLQSFNSYRKVVNVYECICQESPAYFPRIGILLRDQKSAGPWQAHSRGPAELLFVAYFWFGSIQGLYQLDKSYFENVKIVSVNVVVDNSASVSDDDVINVH